MASPRKGFVGDAQNDRPLKAEALASQETQTRLWSLRTPELVATAERAMHGVGGGRGFCPTPPRLQDTPGWPSPNVSRAG